MAFTKRSFAKISWNEIDSITDKLAKSVNRFIKKSNLEIAYIAPIIRGGDIPAVLLSHKLGVLRFFPMQINKQNFLFEPAGIKLPRLKPKQAILLVEGNQVSGGTSNMAVKKIHDIFGKSANVIYVCISTDYSTKDKVKNIVFNDYGILTNEMQTLSNTECKKLGVRSKLTLYPWENIIEELKEANSSSYLD